MRTNKKMMSILLSAVLLLNGCASPKSQAPEIDVAILGPYIRSIDEIEYPKDKQIVALGEATHGNKELIELKQTVFEKTMEQGRKVFVIEGDFGGSYRVNEYISGDSGSAKDAVEQIGFRIYQSLELEKVVDFMRKYNEKKTENEKIRFYGMDMQRYDNNKVILNSILQKADSPLKSKYGELLKDFRDETMYDLPKDKIKNALSELEKLNELLAQEKENIIKKTSQREYDIAQHTAHIIWQNTMLRNAEKDYGTLRDRFMAENTMWILQHEQKFYNNDKIFLSAHNGHLSKTSAIFGTDKVMGQILSEKLGEEYYVIATEFWKSRFVAREEKSNEMKEFIVENRSKGRLATLLAPLKKESLFLDITAAKSSEDEQVKSYLQAIQPISAIGETFSESYQKVEAAYVQNLSLSESFDGIIYFHELHPYSKR